MRCRRRDTRGLSRGSRSGLNVPDHDGLMAICSIETQLDLQGTARFVAGQLPPKPSRHMPLSWRYPPARCRPRFMGLTGDLSERRGDPRHYSDTTPIPSSVFVRCLDRHRARLRLGSRLRGGAILDPPGDGGVS